MIPSWWSRPVFICPQLYGDNKIRNGGTATNNNVAQNVSGEELYHRFLAGDNGAFVDFVKLYEDALSRYLYGIVHDYYETEQLTIETFSQLVLNKKKFNGASSIKTYLFAIGKNLAFQLLKKRGREQQLSFEDAAKITVKEDETPHSYLEKEENRYYLQETMQELKEEYRAVLVLLYFEDMSYIQAGRAMNRSEKQIKNLAYRAKLALKKKLVDKGYAYF